MTSENKFKAIAVGVTVMLFIALGGVVGLFNSNKSLTTGLNDEKIKSERLLSEKLLLNKEIDDAKSQISAMTGKNKELDKFLSEANTKLDQKQLYINSLKKENTSVKSLKKQLSEIQQIRKDLTAQLETLRSDNSQLKDENEKLNSLLASVESEKQKLQQKLMEKDFIASNFRTEILKGKKDKLTVKAKRTDKVRISFDLPVSADRNMENLHLDVISTSGQRVTGSSKVEIQENTNLTASITPGTETTNAKAERINVVFEPESDLKAGVYKIVVFDGNTFLGNTQFRLAK